MYVFTDINYGYLVFFASESDSSGEKEGTGLTAAFFINLAGRHLTG